MPPKRTRRSPEEQIADLKAKIEGIKTRAARQSVKKDPALRHISGAVRSITKALAETRDKATREALTEAQATLSACLALSGMIPSQGPGKARVQRATGPAPAPQKVIAYLRKHPGSRSKEICADLQTDGVTLRSVLHELRDEGMVKVAGKARATRYSAV